MTAPERSVSASVPRWRANCFAVAAQRLFAVCCTLQRGGHLQDYQITDYQVVAKRTRIEGLTRRNFSRCLLLVVFTICEQQRALLYGALRIAPL
jgi:hypothetical protein